MNNTHLLHSAHNAFVATMLIVVLGIGTFFAFEPSVGRAITSDFSVTQQITSEISFLVTAQNVTMAGSILGTTGGYATGTTVTSVSTNNASGYNMTLAFSSTTAMKLNGASSTINNYTPATGGVADFAWIDNASGGAAEFGYSINASTTAEVDQTFKNNGTDCTSGPTVTENRCWMNPSNVAETIINSTSANANSTTTIKFKVAVPNSPSPTLPSGFYVATGTLTAVTN